MYILEDILGVSPLFWQVSLCLALGVSLFLFISSLVIKTVTASVIARMLISGFIFFPGVALFGSIGLSFIAAVPPHMKTWLWLLVFGASLIWCLIELKAYKKRVIERRVIEREFRIERARIVVRQPLKTDLDAAPISDQSILGKIYHNIGPYLVMGIPLAYPLQRILAKAGGDSAILFFLALLGIPITFYFLGRMACGAYLWVYMVWRLERQHGKPVVFDVAD